MTELIIPEELLFDTEDVAYIKREVMNFQPVFVVYDADGQRLAHAPTVEAAMVMAERAELTPYQVN